MAGGKEAEVDRMVVRLMGDASSYKKMMKEAEAVTHQATKSIGTQITKVTKQIMDSGKVLTASLTIPIVGLGVAAIKAGSDFESGFAGVKKTVNASASELAGLRKGFQELLGEIPATQKELLGIGEAAGQLGIRTDKILDFTKTIAMIGVTTNLSTEEGASSMAKFANITRMSQDEFSNLGSSIVALGNNFATTERDIMSMSMRIAGAGSNVGMTASQITALAASLSSVGIEAEMGGSAISHTMLDISKAVALGGEDLEKFAAISQMGAETFSKLWRKDASQGLLAFIKGLNEMDPEKKIVALDDLGVESVRMTDTLLRSSNAVDVFSKALDISQTAFEENTALTKEAEQRYETFASQVVILKNKIGLLLSEGFEIMRPTLIDIGKKIEGVTSWFKGLTKEQKALIIQVGLVVAAIGPLLVVLKGVAFVLGGLKLLIAGGIFGALTLGVGVLIEKTIGFNNVAKVVEKSIKGWKIAIDEAHKGWTMFFNDINKARGVDKFGSGREGMIARAKASRNVGTGIPGLTDFLKENIASLTMSKESLDKLRGIKKGIPSESEGSNKSAFIRDAKKEEEIQKKMKEAVKEKDKAEKDALKTQRDRAKAMADSIQMMKDEAATFGMSAKEIALYRAEQMGASTQEKKVIADLQDQIAAKEKAKEATDKAREAEKRFRDSFKTGGIEGVGRGLDALARLEESRMGRASTNRRSMEAQILAETSGKGGGGKTAANPLANVAAFLNPEQQKMELLYLKLISEDTKRQADKETITLKPAGLGRSGS